MGEFFCEGFSGFVAAFPLAVEDDVGDAEDTGFFFEFVAVLGVLADIAVFVGDVFCVEVFFEFDAVAAEGGGVNDELL